MSRALKDLLYEHVARVGKALSSPKRLELLELLAQVEKTVDVLAKEASIDIKLASAHLRVLKHARLVGSRRAGRFITYFLADDNVATLWATLHTVATERQVELQVALENIASGPERLTAETRRNLLEKVKRGNVVLLDVRPDEEYQSAHLPYARSIPLAELKQRLAELPKHKEIVAYCRGPFCVMTVTAVALLKKYGFKASKISDGVAEWAAAGLVLESD